MLTKTFIRLVDFFYKSSQYLFFNNVILFENTADGVMT